MTVKELEFKAHKIDPTGAHARVDFPNGYGASIVTGQYAYSDAEHPYEVAVMYKGSLCYDTPITDDVIGHQNEEEVNALLIAIEALPARVTA